MKFAFSTNAFRRYTAFEAAEAIARAGYAGLELMCDSPHAFPPDLDPDWSLRFQRHLGGLGMEISNLNSFMLHAIGDTYHPSWIDEDEVRRRQRIVHTAQCLRLARALGAASVSTEPGGPVDKAARERSSSRALREQSKLLDIFEEGVREVLPVAEECRVRLLVEPEPGCLVETSDEILEFIRRFDSEWIGVNLDIGHVFCVGEDPSRAILKLSRHIGHFHLEDIGADRAHVHLIPGAGAIDFGSVLGAIRQVAYEGFVTVELYPYQDFPEEAAREAIEFLGAI